MKYSFTPPLQKSIISHLTKIWIFYILLSLGLIYGYGVYLQLQITAIKAHTQQSGGDITEHDAFINTTNENVRNLQYEINLDSTNQSYNNDVIVAVEKLFDIIPDQITINHIMLEESKLTIKGITPTREAYAFLMEAPLRATFTKTRADFFALPNGWFNFTSISTVGE